MPGSTIPHDRAAEEQLLFAVCAKTLRRLGAEVRIHAGAENSVRALAPTDPFADPVRGDPAGWTTPAAWFRPPEPALAGDPPRVRIEVEGLPNLLHELVHAALAGRLADDHGFDYGAIPYDTDTIDGRAVLWDELSAAVISCAYLMPEREPTADAWTRASAWFDEQLGIQPVFYGLEHEPARFWDRVPTLARTHASELTAMTACGYARVDALLRWGGGESCPRPAALDFWQLWQRRGGQGERA